MSDVQLVRSALLTTVISDMSCSSSCSFGGGYRPSGQYPTAYVRRQVPHVGARG